MLVLAIDTALDACAACLSDPDAARGPRASLSERLDRGHAERLMDMIDEVMTRGGCRFADLDRLAAWSAEDPDTRRFLVLDLRISGDVIAPDDGLLAVGSGGPYALAAARALLRHSPLPAHEVAQEALKIAASICIYTNESITVESL